MDHKTKSLPPVVEIRKRTVPSSGIPMRIIDCRIPSVEANIEQSTIEGLQFFADDITHWLDGAFSEGNAPKPRDDLKLIGSRFFASKGSSSASSSLLNDEEDKGIATIRLIITEADFTLHVPRKQVDMRRVPDRILVLRASDVDAKVETNATGRQETAFHVTFNNTEFLDCSDTSPKRIVARTPGLPLVVQADPLITIRFSSMTDPVSGAKETAVRLLCKHFTIFLDKDLLWAKELARFAKPPEGVFEDVVPSEVVHISIQLRDISVHAAAPNTGGALVAIIEEVEGRTDLVGDGDENVFDFGFVGQLLALDQLPTVDDWGSGNQSSKEVWQVSKGHQRHFEEG